ncbi:hypothetical protein [Clostridium sp.]|uniref:hypothetical protein n=1 Tax=Clostridium sp. TaxID=1506 RepID=UPI00283C6436|nr:hypothetical protein [Clostridium sp.]MDR3598829.1 hypothetical protein [Clostridium sp.]
MVKIKKLNYLLFILLLFIIVLLFYPRDMSKNMDSDISNKIRIISQAHIFFGHQSVGGNIVSGLKKIYSESNQNDSVVEELNDNSRLEGKYFVHTNIGNNGEPDSKFREFENIVNKLSGKKLEIAMMKLCFVDINKNTKLEDVFNSYASMVDSTQKKYPNLTIVHFTVPLKSQPSFINKIKAIIKNRDIDDPQDNIARNRYNDLILSKYSNQFVFDLAKVESTYPDNTREFIIINGKPVYTLIKEYTDDGGHLNKMGQQIIAENLIAKLAQVITLRNTEKNLYRE